jgi:outer membrane protein assembly factor BamB
VAFFSAIQCPVCGAENRFESSERGGQIVCRLHGGPIDVPAQTIVFAEAPLVAAARGAWLVCASPRNGAPLPIRNSPVADGNACLTATLQDLVVGLQQAEIGVRVVWEYRAGAPISGPLAVHFDGTLRAHSSDGRLHGLSAAGQPLWPPVAVGPPLSSASPLVDHEGNTWICAHAGGLIKVDADGGTSRRPYFSCATKFDCTGLLYDGACVVGGEDHFVHCIDLRGARGIERWNLAADRGRTGWYVNSAIALASGPTFVIASGDNHMYGLAADGSQCWKTKLPGQALGNPVVDEQDRIYVGLCRGVTGASPTGALACFDARRREWLWEVATAGAVESTPVVGSDGTIYLGDNSGGISAVSTAGQLSWRLWVGNRAVRSAGTIVSPRRVVFGDDAGRLFALHCESSGLAAGWPQALGARSWNVAATGPAIEALAFGESVRTRIEKSFNCFENPPPVEDEKNQRLRWPVEKWKPALSDDRPVIPEIAPEVPVEPVPIAVTSVPPVGRLNAVIDFRSGIDLLEVSPRPWRVPRSGENQEHPLYLSNGGSGDLLISVRPSGTGALISPPEMLRIRPGRGKFVVLRLESQGDEWVMLEFCVQGASPGRRRTVRVFRPSGK